MPKATHRGPPTGSSTVRSNGSLRRAMLPLPQPSTGASSVRFVRLSAFLNRDPRLPIHRCSRDTIASILDEALDIARGDFPCNQPPHIAFESLALSTDDMEVSAVTTTTDSTMLGPSASQAPDDAKGSEKSSSDNP